MLFLSVLTLLFVGWLYRRYLQRDASSTRLPGPKGWPILGNIFDMPTVFVWKTFPRLKELYGDVIGLNVLGKSVVVLNSRKAIQELLIKKGSIYSDRPAMALISEWGGFDWALFVLPYGKEMHLQRRLFMQCIGPGSYRAYEPISRTCALNHALNILRDPDDFRNHTKLLVASMLLRVIYGHHVKDMQDTYVQNLEMLSHSVENLDSLGGRLVNMFPSLTILPTWVFGKRFSHNINLFYQFSQHALKVAYGEAKRQIERNAILSPSMVDSLLEMNTDENGVLSYEAQIQAVTGASYTAGFENVFSTMYSAILLLMCNPESQQKAQQSLDRVLLQERLPEFSDREALPYIDAILMEVIRWAPATPLGLPHQTTEESMYEGKRIPAGSMIVPNAWMCLHDEADFPDPHLFSPERFLDKDGMKLRKDVPDPRDFLFGFGRRRCPGEYITDDFIWIVIATLLSTFTISKPLDQNGEEIEPDLEYNGTPASIHAKPFKCHFRPRSDTIVDILHHTTEHTSL